MIYFTHYKIEKDETTGSTLSGIPQMGKINGVTMATEDYYCIGFFVAGDYHVLCHEGEEYRFHILNQDSGETPVRLTYYEARTFIETHPLCANISLHDVRIMSYKEIENILEGKSPASTVKSLDLSREEVEEEEEEPLH
jgi:hypothetical protein